MTLKTQSTGAVGKQTASSDAGDRFFIRPSFSVSGAVEWRFLISLLAFLLCGILSARAASITWTNVNGGNWNAAVNWSPNQVPGSSDTAWITNNGNYTVTVSDAESVNVLSLGGASGTQTLNLSGGTFTLSGSSTGNAHSAFTVSGGTFNANGAATLNGLNFSSGTIEGSNPIQVIGTLNWTGGSMQGVVQFVNGTVGTGNLKYLYNSLINNGTMAWNDNINIQSGASVISNAVGSTITLASGVGPINGNGVMANNGTLTMRDGRAHV